MIRRWHRHQRLSAHMTVERVARPSARSFSRPEWNSALSGVVGVVVKACVLPESVDVGRYAWLLCAKSPERGEMLIRNSMRSERGGQGVAGELRGGSRARNGPHVDDELDFRSHQERHKLVDRTGGMSNSEEGVGHALR